MIIREDAGLEMFLVGSLWQSYGTVRGGGVGGWVVALAEPWANCRMFTLWRGTWLIITAGPGHIKRTEERANILLKCHCQQACKRTHKHIHKGRPHTHLSTH